MKNCITSNKPNVSICSVNFASFTDALKHAATETYATMAVLLFMLSWKNVYADILSVLILKISLLLQP